MMTSPNKNSGGGAELRYVLFSLFGNEIVLISVFFRTYNLRWIILLTVSLLNLSNAMSWIALSPVAAVTDKFYGSVGLVMHSSSQFLISNCFIIDKRFYCLRDDVHVRLYPVRTRGYVR